MKIIRWAYICSFVIIINTFPLVVMAEALTDTEKIDDKLLGKLDLVELDKFWTEIKGEYGNYLPEISSKNFSELIKDNNSSFTLNSIVKGIITYLLYEIIMNGKLLGSLIVLTLFSVVLQTTHAAFEQSTVSRIAYFIVYLVLIYIALNSFYLAFSYARQAIDTMGDFMIALLPLMLGIIATLGQFISVAFFHPIIILLIHFSGILLSAFVFPLLYLSALLTIISQLNEHFKVTHLAELLKAVSLGALGVFLTIFLGILSIQGTASSIQDGVALKTTKFIAGNFIPVVGKTLTDAADTILSAALLLKNAVGIIGLLIIVIVAIFPAIKIAVLAFIYKFVAAILQPLGNSPILTAMTSISKYMMYIFACLLIVTLMFFLTIVIMIAASNIPLLLR